MIAFGTKSVAEAALNVESLLRVPVAAKPAAPDPGAARASRSAATPAGDFIRDEVLKRVEPTVAVRMSQEELAVRVNDLVAEIANTGNLLLNQAEQHLVDDMIGLGPDRAAAARRHRRGHSGQRAARDLCRAPRQAGR
jgi:hypothetical protein